MATELTDEPLPQRSRIIDRSPVYYGWIALAAATFGMMMTTPGQTIGVSVFLDRIIEDLGVSRSTVSLLYTFGTLAGSFALPFIGRFIDRRGPRIAVIITAGLFALACVYMGFVQGLLMLGIGFVLIRGLGQGALGLVSLHVINIWFVRRRGLAVGISGLGMASATAFAPLLIEGLMDTFGWRSAYMLLGLLLALVMLPLGALLYRGHPERFGLEPDGRPAKGRSKLPLNEINYTLAQARRTATFWLFVAGDICISALSTGLIFHHYSIMAAGGLDRTTAATVFIFFGFITAGTNFLNGVLLDRTRPRFLLSAMLLFQCAALALATQVSSPQLIIVYGALLGLTMGMKGAISSSVYAYYFGRKFIGSIKGFATTLSIAGTAFGPLLFALGLEGFGSYTPILYLSALPPLAVALAAPFMRPPAREASV